MSVENQISLRETIKTDIGNVITLERDPVNIPFIRQWSEDQHLASLKNDHYGHYIIENSNNDFLGYVILTGLDNPDQSIEFKRIVINNKSQGIGKKAVQLIKQLAFNTLHAHRLWLEVMTTNQRACAVYQSHGFVKEGIHRESLKMGDQFISLIVMSILKPEYESES